MEFDVIPISEREKYLDLLLIADEDERMVRRYIAAGEMTVFRDKGGIIGECIAIECGDDTVELKSLATVPEHRLEGYGRKILEFAKKRYSHDGKRIIVGTGDAPTALRFYERCGFSEYSRIAGFFTDNYPHPIIESGVQLKDMVMLEFVPGAHIEEKQSDYETFA